MSCAYNEIEVISKTKDGKIFTSDLFLFKETDEGWQWKREAAAGWAKIKSKYSEAEKAYGADLGKLVFDKSN